MHRRPSCGFLIEMGSAAELMLPGSSQAQLYRIILFLRFRLSGSGDAGAVFFFTALGLKW